MDWLYWAVPLLILLVVIVYVFRPGSRRKYDEASKIPLEEKKPETQRPDRQDDTPPRH